MRFTTAIAVLVLFTPACDGDELSLVREEEKPPVADPADPADPVDPAPCSDRTRAIDVVPTDRSTHVFMGSEPDAKADGTFYVRGPNGEELRGPVAIGGGEYSVEIPLFCGAQTSAVEFPIEGGCTTRTEYRVQRIACSGVDIFKSPTGREDR